MFVIQPIEADRWRTYRDLRLASLADAPHAFGSRLETERTLREEDWRRRLAGRTQFVAFVDGRPVGTVGCRPEGDEMELVSMWVEPEARRWGVARGLVAAVIEDARRRGSRSVILWVAHTNAAAERLYAGCGFVRTGRVQPIDDSDPTRGSEFQMQLPLSSASRDDSQS